MGLNNIGQCRSKLTMLPWSSLTLSIPLSHHNVLFPSPYQWCCLLYHQIQPRWSNLTAVASLRAAGVSNHGDLHALILHLLQNLRAFSGSPTVHILAWRFHWRGRSCCRRIREHWRTSRFEGYWGCPFGGLSQCGWCHRNRWGWRGMALGRRWSWRSQGSNDSSILVHSSNPFLIWSPFFLLSILIHYYYCYIC